MSSAEAKPEILADLNSELLQGVTAAAGVCLCPMPRVSKGLFTALTKS